jgi:hypothetical protein
VWYRLVLAVLVSVVAAGCTGFSLCDLTTSSPPPQFQIASLQMPDNAGTILGPRLAVSAGGTAIAGWRMSTSDPGGTYDEVYVTEFRQATWGPPRSVSHRALTGFVLTPPRVTMNRSGRAVVGWIDGAGTAAAPVLRLARFDGSQWQPEILNVLEGQIGLVFDMRLLDDDRLVVAYEPTDLPRRQVALATSSGSVLAGSVGFGSSVASSSCQQTTDCTADGVVLALRADGIGLVGWRQRTTLDPGDRARAAPVDVNTQGSPVGSDVDLHVAELGSAPSTGEFALSVQPDGTIATAVRQVDVFPTATEGISGRVSADPQTSIGGAYAIRVRREISMGQGRLLDSPRVAANRGGSALFAWVAHPEQASTLDARIWSPLGRLEPEISEPAFTIDTGVVPGDQGQWGPRVALSNGGYGESRPVGTLVYATSSAQNANAVRGARLYLFSSWFCPDPWSLDGPVTLDSTTGQLTAIDLATFSNGAPIAVWLRREAGQIVFRAAR